jgi:hypothetical protein
MFEVRNSQNKRGSPNQNCCKFAEDGIGASLREVLNHFTPHFTDKFEHIIAYIIEKGYSFEIYYTNA